MAIEDHGTDGTGLMTDDVMGLVNHYLSHPPPLRKRARGCDNRTAHCIHKIQHLFMHGLTQVPGYMYYNL